MLEISLFQAPTLRFHFRVRFLLKGYIEITPITGPCPEMVLLPKDNYNFSGTGFVTLNIAPFIPACWNLLEWVVSQRCCS